MKKFLKIAAPVLVIAAGVSLVMFLAATKPPPEKKEDEVRLVSLDVDDGKSESVRLHI